MRKLDNVICGDGYTTAATISDVIGSSGGYFSIVNNDVYMELQYGQQGQTNFTDEIHIPAGGGVLVPGTTGVRFRNYIAGRNATVSAALAEKSEPAIQINATGVASTSGIITPATSLPLSPTDGQQAILTR